jgi:hypothetical protein
MNDDARNHEREVFLYVRAEVGENERGCNTEYFVSFILRMQWKTAFYLYMQTSGYKYLVY